jgi:glutathionylspermidine synthase
MRRLPLQPRAGWASIVEGQGLIPWEDGTALAWHESACYALEREEVGELQRVARLLAGDLLVAAGDHVVEHDLFHRLGIPAWAVDRIRQTWRSRPPALCGRIDLAYGPDGVPKLLEIDAEIPACLPELAVQHHWLADRFPGRDQWNRVPEALVQRWRELSGAGRLPGDRVHLLHGSGERTAQDRMTLDFLTRIVRAAGLDCEPLAIDDLAIAPDGSFADAAGRPIRTALKLYPWEWLVHERSIGALLASMGDGPGETQWIEPIWKMLFNSNGILPVLWELFPDHPNLLPAYFDGDPRAADLPAVVRKPLIARESADITIIHAGRVVERGAARGYGEEGYVVQAFTDLGDHDGAHPVLGVVMVGETPLGLGIRESDTLITDDRSRFVPHVIANMRTEGGRIAL